MKYLTEPPKKFLFDGCKLAWYPEKLDQLVKGDPVLPVTIDMGIHKGCNMKCVFCYGVYQQPSSDFIPTERLMLLARDAGLCGIKGIAIIGDGEPTLNPGLYPFVQALTYNKVASAVATNGLLLDRSKIDILTENCSWLRFNISAVGAKYPEIHKGTTEADYERLVVLMKYAADHKRNCTIGLQMVLIPDNFDQVIPLAKLGLELGVDYVQIKQFSDAGEGMPMHFNMEQYEQAKPMLEEAQGMSTDKTEIIVKWSAMEDTKSITEDKQWEFERCIDLPLLFQISGNGKCYPCGYLFNKDEYCYGDVTEDRLWNILHSQQYRGIIQKIAQTELKDLCQGQCRHTCSNKFMDRFIRVYRGNAELAISELCGSTAQYKRLKDNPPEHMAFD